jgi:hypothetical protein
MSQPEVHYLWDEEHGELVCPGELADDAELVYLTRMARAATDDPFSWRAVYRFTRPLFPGHDAEKNLKDYRACVIEDGQAGCELAEQIARFLNRQDPAAEVPVKSPRTQRVKRFDARTYFAGNYAINRGRKGQWAVASI